MYQLLEVYYEDVKAIWEERFEKKYGFWRGFVDTVVARYLDCGVAEAGFARLKCDDCGSERLLALSCKQRGICPSCDAKRAAAFAAFLKDELLENVGHCLWTFTLPKMLRPYFMRQRELLGDLARLAYETYQGVDARSRRRPSRPPRRRCGPADVWKCSQSTSPCSLPCHAMNANTHLHVLVSIVLTEKQLRDVYPKGYKRLASARVETECQGD